LDNGAIIRIAERTDYNEDVVPESPSDLAQRSGAGGKQMKRAKHSFECTGLDSLIAVGMAGNGPKGKGGGVL